MVYGETGNGAQSDKRAVVFHSVVIGTFQQNTLRKQVAHLQVRAHRRMQVAGQRFVVGGISKFFHGFSRLKNFRVVFVFQISVNVFIASSRYGQYYDVRGLELHFLQCS